MKHVQLEGCSAPASSTGFSKAKQARILTREEGSSADFDARGGITCERGARAGGLEASAERKRWVMVKYPPDERSRATGDEAGSAPQHATTTKVQICISCPESVKCGRCHPFCWRNFLFNDKQHCHNFLEFKRTFPILSKVLITYTITVQ